MEIIDFTNSNVFNYFMTIYAYFTAIMIVPIAVISLFRN